MNREANLTYHIKTVNESMKRIEQKIMDSESLTPFDIVSLNEQTEYQNCMMWLANIKRANFPEKIIMNGNAKS